MKVYISGPMTGEIGLGFDVFTRAAATLRAEGYDVVSPHEIEHPGETFPGSLPWTDYLRRDLRALLECDAIALLPGWTRSAGARLELLTAVHLNFEIFTYADGRRGSSLRSVSALEMHANAHAVL